MGVSEMTRVVRRALVRNGIEPAGRLRVMASSQTVSDDCSLVVKLEHSPHRSATYVVDLKSAVLPSALLAGPANVPRRSASWCRTCCRGGQVPGWRRSGAFSLRGVSLWRCRPYRVGSKGR